MPKSANNSLCALYYFANKVIIGVSKNERGSDTMTERIRKLAERTVNGKMFVETVKTEYDRCDLFLSPIKMSAKRVCEYIMNQEPLITEESRFIGNINFDGSVVGDIFTRSGHENFWIAGDRFYNQPVDRLLTFEWQHSAADFGKIIRIGLGGVKKEIEDSKSRHASDKEKLEFLETQELFCNTVISWAHKCSERALEFSRNTENAEYSENLRKLSEALKKVPENPAESLYEAILSLYVCYSYYPDSIGLIDRYLYSYYKKDLQNGIITNEIAAEYLQELFLMVQARTHISSDRFYRGGESHFCVGGCLANGEDGFNEFSRLIVESLLDLPTWIPQITLRWTKKTPTEVLRFMMNCERNDPNKRIAFANDEPRIHGLMKYTGLSYEDAVNYTMVGCNEIALPGGIVFQGADMMNILRSVDNTFTKRAEDIKKTETFEDFMAVYREELFADLDEAEKIAEGFQTIRNRDKNIVSNIFIDGCIERGEPISPSSVSKFIALVDCVGIPNVIDSLTVVKQFVFDEGLFTMDELVRALAADWNGYEDMHTLIKKKCDFFGNDADISNDVAHRFFALLDEWNTGDNFLGKKYLFGDLIGYNEHHKFFGELTGATPDGRCSGAPLTFGIGQTGGRDRDGLTALLTSVAGCDPFDILTGPSVTNISLDSALIKNDESFEKLVSTFENYFKSGGTHFQLTYVSKKDLVCAQKDPEKYKSLRVRVSGFSDYFVFLNEALQNDIIARTEQKG